MAGVDANGILARRRPIEDTLAPASDAHIRDLPNELITI